jgi:hypothetical protein
MKRSRYKDRLVEWHAGMAPVCCVSHTWFGGVRPIRRRARTEKLALCCKLITCGCDFKTL